LGERPLLCLKRSPELCTQTALPVFQKAAMITTQTGRDRRMAGKYPVEFKKMLSRSIREEN